MQCTCGGETIDKDVIRNKKKAGEYRECRRCGRMSWIWKTDELTKELQLEKENDRQN